MEQVLEIKLESISPSKTNPRRTFDKDALGELTTSIKEKGVLQPILVRKVGKEFEIIAGERRFKASKAAGLDKIPARVMDVDDKGALEIQVIENLQRADLHPLEEGEGYRVLIEKHDYQVSDLAAKVHKSASYVHHRLGLTKLSPKVKKAFLEEDLKPAEVELIGRIEDHKLQEQAMERHWNSTAELKRMIEEQFLLDLKKAPWNLADEKLVPSCGACNVCPKRNSAQGDLFGSGKRDFCLDASCWAGKVKAHSAILVRRYKDEGRTVLEGVKAKEALANRYDSKYSVLDSNPNWMSGSGSLRSALKGEEFETVLAIGPETGKAYEVIETETARRLVGKNDRNTYDSGSGRRKVSAAEQLKRKKVLAEIRGRKKACEETANLLAEQFSKKPLKGETFRMLMRYILRTAGHDSKQMAAKRMGLQPKDHGHYKDWSHPLDEIVNGNNEAQWLELIAQLMIGKLDFPDYGDHTDWQHFEPASVSHYRGESKEEIAQAKNSAFDVCLEEMFKTGHAKRVKKAVEDQLAGVKAPKKSAPKKAKKAPKPNAQPEPDEEEVEDEE